MLPWIEKYRPKNLNDVVGNKEAVNKLKVILNEKNIPNMILSGPPGSGKTSSIFCIANELLGGAAKEALLELNASDERGIDTVRKSIKMFCKKQVNNLPKGTHKLVLLDEADNMTPSAQQALRRIIEIYSNTTRFLFACNSSSRIVEAIQSRCVTLKFTRLTESQIMQRLQEILDKENVEYDKEGLKALVFISDGDMRQVLNNAQAISCNKQKITAENVYGICDKPHPDEMNEVVSACINGNHRDAQRLILQIHSKGYSIVDILDTLFKVIKKSSPENTASAPKTTQNSPNISLRMEYIKEIGMTHMHVTKGIDSLLQMNALIARLCNVSAVVNT